MASNAHQSPLKPKPNIVIVKLFCIGLLTGNCKLSTVSTAATDTKRTAVAAREPFAAFASFQCQHASFPPTQNVMSAPRSRSSAGQFSGNCAIYAANATTIAISATF